MQVGFPAAPLGAAHPEQCGQQQGGGECERGKSRHRSLLVRDARLPPRAGVKAVQQWTPPDVFARPSPLNFSNSSAIEPVVASVCPTGVESALGEPRCCAEAMEESRADAE
jgi:hypothetical protein